MKILIVCQFFYPEGFSINDVAKRLVELGHDVLVVTGQPNYGYKRIMDGYEHITDEVLFGARVHRCKLKPRKEGRLSIITNYLSFWSSSKRYLRSLKEEFDVVYSMSLSPLISIVGATIYARKHHVKHVLHCLDLWPESTVVTGAVRKGSLMYRVLFHWCKKIYSNIDEILISSPSFEKYFTDVLGVKNVPISYVPQPPQIADYSEAVAYDHKVNFVYAGNIGTLQLVESLVQAVDMVKEEMDVCLHLIGMGARTEAVQSLIKQLHLESNVRFYGVKPRSVTAGYYAKATAIIVSLRQGGTVGETIPSKLNSGLYYGRPILGVLGGDGAKLIQEARCGVLSEGEDVNAIADAMRRLGKMSEGEREILGRNARAYFDKKYRLETVIDDILLHLNSSKISVN